MSTMLESLGISIQGLRAANLTPTPDCIIVGNAIPRGNPEVEERSIESCFTARKRSL
jgi:UDP-N-acetylmuramate: L-alanyl-gamma-D-glutamyl-meso-diaminopimelate ligase